MFAFTRKTDFRTGPGKTEIKISPKNPQGLDRWTEKESDAGLYIPRGGGGEGGGGRGNMDWIAGTDDRTHHSSLGAAFSIFCILLFFPCLLLLHIILFFSKFQNSLKEFFLPLAF